MGTAPTSSAGAKAGSTGAAAARATGAGDSAALAHDAFFARVIGMIPRELYKPAEEEDDTNAKYYKHKKQALSSEAKKSIRCAAPAPVLRACLHLRFCS